MGPTSEPTTTPARASSTGMAPESDDSMKLAIAMALIRSKLHSKSDPTFSSSSRSSSSFALHWKKKAKVRKQEIIRLTQDLKEAEDSMRSDLYPPTATCECYFFNNLETVGYDQCSDDFQCDQRFTDILRRRFLRQARLHGRIKKREKNASHLRAFAELCREEEMEQLKLSADFLMDLCESPCPVKKPNFTNLAHQAVDFICCSVKHILSLGKDLNLLLDIVSSLIMQMVKRMCTLIGDELYDCETDTQIHIQHILRKLASVSFIGLQILHSVSHRISELAESLLFLDPFDESFSLVHDSLFVMIQLIEFLVSDFLVTWSKEESFDIELFEEWMISFLDARKALQLLEKRSGIYALYMDRVTGELARQAAHVSSIRKLNQEILDNLFS